MHEDILEDLGLTRNESLVYLSLLKLGKSKSGKIVKKAGISSGKIYETLNKLISKGLVKTVTENGVKQFIANNPEMLLSYLKDKQNSLKDKEKELEKLIPSFNSLKIREDNLEMVSLVRGLKGVSAVVYQTLEKSESPFYIMGVRSSKEERYNNFWMNWHRERVKLGKNAKLLFSDKKTEYWNFFKKLKYTQVKELTHISQSAIMIIGNQTFIFSYEKEITCIQITSEAITNSLLNFFNDLWKIA